MKWHMYVTGVVALSIVFQLAGCSKPATTTTIPTTVVTTSTTPATTASQNNRQFGQTID